MNTLTEALSKLANVGEKPQEEKVVLTEGQKELKESLEKKLSQVNKNNYKNSFELSKVYEKAIQEGINNLYPDAHWSQITKADIMATLLENKNDVNKTVDKIVNESTLNELFGLGKKKKKQQNSGPQPVSMDKLLSHLRNKFSFMNKDDLTDERLMTAIKIGNNSLDWKDELKQEMQSGRLHNIEHWAYKGLDFMAGSRRWQAAAKADDEREVKKEQERQKSYNSKTWRGGHDPKAPSSGHYNRDGSWQYESLNEALSGDLYDYDQAVEYIASRGLPTEPDSDLGEYVYELLSEYSEPCYTREILDQIIELAEEVDGGEEEYEESLKESEFLDSKKVAKGEKAKSAFHDDPTNGMTKSDYIDWLMAEKGMNKQRAQEQADMFYESLDESKSLDEDTPEDLRKAITRDSYTDNSYRSRGRGLRGSSDYFQARARGDNVDFAASDAQEVDPKDALKALKAGEDMSKYFLMLDNGQTVQLDKWGHPNRSPYALARGGGDERENASLKTMLGKAAKVYKYDYKLAKDTHPERFADEGEREANLRRGSMRWDVGAYDDDEEDAQKYHQYLQYKGNKSAIDAARKAYEDGDISRKEMERRIEQAQADSPSDWQRRNAKDAYNRKRKQKAADTYYASNKKLQEPIERLGNLRGQLRDAQRDLNWTQRELTQARGSGDSYYVKRAEEVRKKIADLQRDLERYENEIAKSQSATTIANFEKKEADYQAKIDQVQADLDALLRRSKSESFRKEEKKALKEKGLGLNEASESLDEAKDLDKRKGSFANEIQSNKEVRDEFEQAANLGKAKGLEHMLKAIEKANISDDTKKKLSAKVRGTSAAGWLSMLGTMSTGEKVIK